LPESHACPMYAIARPPRSSYVISGSTSYDYSPRLKPGKIGRKEATSFLIGAVLVWLVGFEILISFSYPAQLYQEALLVNSILFVAAFLLHEYAHKLVANFSGLWAEFRLNMIGVLLTALSIFTPFFKIISPGVTMISGVADTKTLGKIAIWGPVVNIIMSLALLPVLFLPKGSILLPSFYLNGFIAVFNLLPIGILDGKKVFDYSKLIWTASFAYSLISSVFALYLLNII
jgi:Zn-dependent protease